MKYGKQAMPIYEYRCERCGEEFELLLPSSGAAARCPGCSSAQVKKRFSLFAVTGSSRQSGQGKSPSCGGCRSRNCSTCR
jgi:putative FmdB family regulatory protein